MIYKKTNSLYRQMYKWILNETHTSNVRSMSNKYAISKELRNYNENQFYVFHLIGLLQ